MGRFFVAIKRKEQKMLVIAGMIGCVSFGFLIYWLYSLIRSKFDGSYMPPLKPWMSFVIGIVSFVVAGVLANKSPEMLSNAQTPNEQIFAQNQVQASKITMEKFKQIQTGMSYQQVIAILGREGEELSRSDIAGYTTVMYQWSEGFSNMNAMFQNNRLVQKAQFGLE
jgi:hypothetical protein